VAFKQVIFADQNANTLKITLKLRPKILAKMTRDQIVTALKNYFAKNYFQKK
jgi:hypothetical protein